MAGTTHRFQFLVIGGGSGGISAANRARSHGITTAVVESGRWGGTCVNVGCVPKKLMFNAAHLAASRALLPGYGFSDGGVAPVFDWAVLKQRRDAYVKMLNKGYEEDLRDTDISHFSAHAKFVGERRVQLSSGEIIEVRSECTSHASVRAATSCARRPSMSSLPQAPSPSCPPSQALSTRSLV